MRRFAPQLFAQLFCITLLLLSVSKSQAQLRNRGDVHNRGMTLSNIRRDVTVDRLRREKLLAQLALKNDFRKLQIVNNDLMKRVFKPSASQAITQKEIRSSLGEIKKLAERLRSNFGLPKMEADEPANNLALKPGLLQLDQALMSFVDNPLLGELRVYDTELATQAARDLSDVARIAEALRKSIKEK